MPELGSTAQVPLLQAFQQLVELKESGRVLMDVHQAPSHERQYSETKDILETWRCAARALCVRVCTCAHVCHRARRRCCWQAVAPIMPRARMHACAWTSTRGTRRTLRNPTARCACRLRTPNEWDTLAHWQDVLMWRNHVYNVVIAAFAQMSEIAPQLHQMGYRDKAWSVNKLGHVAFK
jgi:hypothetical protein